MKRILLTVHKFFPEHQAGTEVLTLKIAKELQRRSYQVAILCANPPDTKAEISKGTCNEPELTTYEYEELLVYCLSESARLKANRFSNEHYHPYLKTHYKKILKSFAPDLVHCFHLQNLSASLIEEVQAKNIPLIYSATDFWLICPIVQLRRPDGSNCEGPGPLAINCLTCYTPEILPKKKEFAGALAARFPQQWKKLATLSKPLQNLFQNTAYWGYLGKKSPAAALATIERPALLKHFANQLDAITVPTKLMQNLFIKNGLDKSKIHHIPYGIDTEPLRTGQQKEKSDKLRIAFIGTLAEHKGPDLLVEAFQQLPTQYNAVLTLYGDDRQFPEYNIYLRQLINKNNPDNKIKLAGTFPNSEIGKIFSTVDILVVPSRWYENTPLVIQSALAAKTPVIATNLGGMSEIVKHEINGLLFEPNNAESLTKELAKLFTDRALLPRLKNNIAPERSIADMVDDLELLYEVKNEIHPD